jgi:hypothetical protein
VRILENEYHIGTVRIGRRGTSWLEYNGLVAIPGVKAIQFETESPGIGGRLFFWHDGSVHVPLYSWENVTLKEGQLGREVTITSEGIPL